MNDEPDNWGKFRELGTEEVRRLLAAGRYGGGRALQAQKWLEFQDFNRDGELLSEQMEIARSAADAARDSADAARDAAIEAREANSLAEIANARARSANRIATIAVITSFICAAAAIYVSYRSISVPSEAGASNYLSRDSACVASVEPPACA